MLVAYFLSMPNCGSWNGEWTGKGYKFVKVRKYTKQQCRDMMHNPDKIGESKQWSYRWSDGWSAMVTAKKIDSKTANNLRKSSDGFCGYEWMIDSIEKTNKIEA
jgi:hypothetical protein